MTEENARILSESAVNKIKDLFMGRAHTQSGEPITKYRSRIDGILSTIYEKNKGRSIVVDYVDLSMIDLQRIAGGEQFQHDNMLSKLIIENPDDMIKELEGIFEECLVEVHGEEIVNSKPFYVRINNMYEAKGFELVRADKVEKLIQIKGTVIQSIPCKFVLVKGKYRCMKCLTEWEFTQPYALRYFSIPQCTNENCSENGKSRSVELVFKSSYFVDYEEIIVQEESSYLEKGRTSRTNKVVLRDDLVDYVNPGDFVNITGILKVVPIKNFNLNKDEFHDPLFYATILCSDVEVIKISENRTFSFSEEQFRSKVSTPELAEQWWREMIGMVAPGIEGLEHIKEAVLLQLFSSVPVKMPDGTDIKDKINVLIIGDPGTAKTSIAESIKTIVDRYQYASTQSSSMVGLTASVNKDQNGQWVLSAGAAVLADQGILVIDEFEKTEPEEMTKLHEVLGQQRITLMKADIKKVLNARCDVLALANPTNSRFDFDDFKKNVKKIPLSIFSRFDLIFVLPDIDPRKPMDAQIEQDRRITEFMISKAKAGALQTQRRLPTPEEYAFFKEYIKFAKSVAQNRFSQEEVDNGSKSITLSDRSAEKLKDFFIEARKPIYTNNADVPIPITRRFNNSLIRLTLARAKALLKDQADESDADKALELVKIALTNTSSDGKWDSSQVESVPSRSESTFGFKVYLQMLHEQSLKSQFNEGYPTQEFLDYMSSNCPDFNEKKSKTMMSKLIKEGYVMESGDNIILTAGGKRLIKVENSGESKSSKPNNNEDDEEELTEEDMNKYNFTKK